MTRHRQGRLFESRTGFLIGAYMPSSMVTRIVSVRRHKPAPGLETPNLTDDLNKGSSRLVRQWLETVDDTRINNSSGRLGGSAPRLSGRIRPAGRPVLAAPPRQAG